ncbi:MAG: hypothetical protein BWY52_02865 [Chloroflexi bacterium ADurb.Bin325]|nr:MAG: hypothetical protein BWY52_02865 [Chloroflexi bacterium ADurb.Bin325]
MLNFLLDSAAGPLCGALVVSYESGRHDAAD